MCIRRPVLGVRGESLGTSLGPIHALNRKWAAVDAVGVEEREQNANIFHACIHALPIEGHHGVSSVAEDYDARAEMIWRACKAYERKVGVRSELLQKRFRGYDVGHQARNMVFEEGQEAFVAVLRRGQLLKCRGRSK